MSDGAVAVFVKTPGYSAVKTRLAADCGEDYATAWYLRACAAVAAVARVAQDRFGVHAYWAVAEDEALGAGCWSGLRTVAQGEGGLGERMARVHTQLVAMHGSAILIGADAPQLSAELLAEALGWLREPPPRLVLGPARDGGFWLFGANRPLPTQAWTSVPYSVPETSSAFHAALADYGEWRTIEMLVDVDHRNDLRVVLDALQALPRLLPEQSALADWMLERQGVML